MIYYKSVDEPPHIIWIFTRDILPDDCKISQKDSDTGDKCHYVIVNLSDNKAKKIFNKYGNIPDNLDTLYICDNGRPRKLEKSDINNFLY